MSGTSKTRRKTKTPLRLILVYIISVQSRVLNDSFVFPAADLGYRDSKRGL